MTMLFRILSIISGHRQNHMILFDLGLGLAITLCFGWGGFANMRAGRFKKKPALLEQQFYLTTALYWRSIANQYYLLTLLMMGLWIGNLVIKSISGGIQVQLPTFTPSSPPPSDYIWVLKLTGFS